MVSLVDEANGHRNSGGVAGPREVVDDGMDVRLEPGNTARGEGLANEVTARFSAAICELILDGLTTDGLESQL
jgi:hypothetical protein